MCVCADIHWKNPKATGISRGVIDWSAKSLEKLFRMKFHIKKDFCKILSWSNKLYN